MEPSNQDNQTNPPASGGQPLEGITSKIPGTLDDKIAEKVTDTADSLSESMQNAASDGVAKVQDMAEAAVDAVRNTSDTVVDKAQDVVAPVVQTVNSTTETVVDKAQDVAATVTDQVQSAAQAVTGQMPEIKEKGKGFFGKLMGLFGKK